MEGKKVFKKNLQFRLRTIMGKSILMGFNINLELNEIAKDIWNNMDGVKDLDTIINKLYEEYDCPKDILEKDVFEFVELLSSKNAVTCEG